MEFLYFEMLEFSVVCPFVKWRQLSVPSSLAQHWTLLLLVLTNSHKDGGGEIAIKSLKVSCPQNIMFEG